MDRFEMWRNKVKLVLLVGTILCHGVTASPPQKEEVGEIGATNLEPSSQKLWDLDPFGSDNGSNDVVYSDYILTPAFPSFSNDDEGLCKTIFYKLSIYIKMLIDFNLICRVASER